MATSVKEAGVVLGKQKSEAAGRWPEWVQWLKHLLGLDWAIAYTVLARVVQILGSTGTVLLILRYLTPVEQGYYYTLLSLVSLQTVFELGFSFVILQMAAHESVHLKFHADGRVEGDPVAHARLASILQKTLRWYLAAAVVLCASLLPVGVYFFSRHAQTGPPVAWQGPWVVAVFATGLLFLLNPFFSFLEGCGQVWQVGRVRFGQAILGALMAWGALLSGHGLYSPGMVVAAYIAVGCGFLWTWRKLLVTLMSDTANGSAVSWGLEVWPFQWKIAVSWICAYFTIQIFTPVLFAYRGSTEAGQFGMSLGIVTYLSTLVLAWMSTKATPFGKMIARGDFSQLRRVFFRTLRQSILILVGISATCEAGVVTLHYLVPRLAARMVSPALFAILLLAALGSFLVQSMAIYLRSFKREPFLLQSVVVAMLTVSLSLATVKAWGTAGVGACYLVCTGIIGLALGAATFHGWQRVQGQGSRRADVLVGAP
jgi:hypothetical protein